MTAMVTRLATKSLWRSRDASRPCFVRRTSAGAGAATSSSCCFPISDLGSRPLKVIADAMRRGLSNPVSLRDGRAVPVTVSVGACLAEPGETVEQVADMADAALYNAKEDGRDRIVVYDPTKSRSTAGGLAG